MTTIDNDDYLIFSTDKYKYYRLPVNAETRTMADHLRKLHKERLEDKKYGGYCEEIDNEYHEVGTYFYVRNIKKNHISMGLRLNLRSQTKRFPFEMGTKANGERYCYKEKGKDVADLNTYSFKLGDSKNVSETLFNCVASELKEEKITWACGLADIKSDAIIRIYTDLDFQPSEDYPDPVQFETFVHKDSGLPVEWMIMEWNKQQIEDRAKDFEDLRKIAQSAQQP